MRPTKFKCGALHYKIVYSPTLISDTGGVGQHEMDIETITIASESAGGARPFSERYVKSTLWHEIVHAILTQMGETERSDDERFVEGFANLLAQVIDTME